MKAEDMTNEELAAKLNEQAARIACYGLGTLSEAARRLRRMEKMEFQMMVCSGGCLARYQRALDAEDGEGTD